MINNSIWVYAYTENTHALHMQYNTIPMIFITLAFQRYWNLLCCQKSLHSFFEISRNCASEVLRNHWVFLPRTCLLFLFHVPNKSKDDNDVDYQSQSTIFYCNYGSVHLSSFISDCNNVFLKSGFLLPQLKGEQGRTQFCPVV